MLGYILTEITVTFIAMYTVNKNPLYLKNCVIYKNILDN